MDANTHLAVQKLMAQGNDREAERILTTYLNGHPNDVNAWLFLFEASSTLEQKKTSLENALGIDPKNLAARRALELLLSTSTVIREGIPRETHNTQSQSAEPNLPQLDPPIGKKPQPATSPFLSNASIGVLLGILFVIGAVIAATGLFPSRKQVAGVVSSPSPIPSLVLPTSIPSAAPSASVPSAIAPLVLPTSIPSPAPSASAATPILQQVPSEARPTRILFIGNSYTYYNGGIDKEVEGLAPTSQTSSIAVGGYTLENHWNDGAAARSIRGGSWTFVVLQEQSQRPVIDPQGFYKFSSEFDAVIRASGAKTVLLMTWQRPDSVAMGVTTANLASAYEAVGRELGAEVVPAGLAFGRSLLERPDLLLYSQDGHPTADGTYLAACVLYGIMFRQTPAGNGYSGAGVNKDDAAFLQRDAAEILGF